jgi:hypothetical protein
MALSSTAIAANSRLFFDVKKTPINEVLQSLQSQWLFMRVLQTRTVIRNNVDIINISYVIYY